jgi:hypothetical protein
LGGVNQQTIVSDDPTNAITVPNCTLYTGQDIYGNDIQALVPFVKDPDAVFGDIEDWDGAQPVKGPVVFASTIRAVIGGAL